MLVTLGLEVLITSRPTFVLSSLAFGVSINLLLWASNNIVCKTVFGCSGCKLEPFEKAGDDTCLYAVTKALLWIPTNSKIFMSPR